MDPVIPPVVVPAQIVWSLQIEEYADSIAGSMGVENLLVRRSI
jgi:hypothetical protein